MAEDGGQKDEEKLEFDSAGQGFGYISLDQARVLAMRTARETPGEYGRRFTNVPMAFEVVEDEETEDHYVVTLSVRPQGRFTGTPGREQFFIEKEGTVAHRQVLSLPVAERGRRFPLIPISIGLAAVVIAAVVFVVFVADRSGSGEGEDSPVAGLVPTITPASTITPAPVALIATAVPTPTLADTPPPAAEVTPEAVLTAEPVRIPTPTYIPTPTPTATTTPVPAPTTSILNSTPTTPPTPLVVDVPTGVLVSRSVLLGQPWMQGTLEDDPNTTWINQRIGEFHLSTDGSTIFGTSQQGMLYRSSDGGKAWRTVAKSAVECRPDTPQIRDRPWWKPNFRPD